MYNGSGAQISWKFFEELLKIQRTEGLSVANKLSLRHTQYHNQKMNVKLAAQTFSKSVADALTYAKEYFDELKGCEATIEFINIINDAFDILNSRNLTAFGFKKGLSTSNAEVVFIRLNEIMEYINSLYM